MARRLQEYEEQQELIARTEEFIRRYKAGQRSREAKGRQTRLDRLERVDRPQEHGGSDIARPTNNAQWPRGGDCDAPLRVGYNGSGAERRSRVHARSFGLSG